MGTTNGGETIFTVSFGGDDDNRNHELLQLIFNALTGATSIVITKLSEGSPINAIAQDVSYSTVKPTGVSFSSLAISLGLLRAEEGFPLWRRIFASDKRN